MKTLLAVALMVSITLVGCNRPTNGEVVSVSTRYINIRVDYYDPPKYVRVSFTDLDNGNQIKELYISKRCSRCKDMTGKIVKIKATDVLYDENGKHRLVRNYDRQSIKDAISSYN